MLPPVLKRNAVVPPLALHRVRGCVDDPNTDNLAPKRQRQRHRVVVAARGGVHSPAVGQPSGATATRGGDRTSNRNRRLRAVRDDGHQRRW